MKQRKSQAQATIEERVAPKPDMARLLLDDHPVDLPVVRGTMNEVGVDITRLRQVSGAITLDSGYANTGSCTSSITFIDGERGILMYRGYPIETMAETADFVEICYLLLNGGLPDRHELDEFRDNLTRHSLIHEDMKKFFESYPPTAHPMTILSAMVASLSAYYSEEDGDLNIIRLLAKLKTIAAFSYKKSIGQPYVYPRNDLPFASDFLHMMFAVPSEPYHVDPVLSEALNLLLVLHADHEQNCSTATVRMVGSSGASLFAAISAGISALSGHLHGGANQAVIQMLQRIHDDGGNTGKYVKMAKDRDSGFKLMGFGHRVYKNFDPRARILKEIAGRILARLGRHDPLLDIARKLETAALEDEYFVQRSLYPNVDFYSGILYRAMGIPTNMFTVMFALGRLPGWIAHWKEMKEDPNLRIYRPRQIYVGSSRREYVAVDER